jgi:hypothetical protein
VNLPPGLSVVGRQMAPECGRPWSCRWLAVDSMSETPLHLRKVSSKQWPYRTSPAKPDSPGPTSGAVTPSTSIWVVSSLEKSVFLEVAAGINHGTCLGRWARSEGAGDDVKLRRMLDAHDVHQLPNLVMDAVEDDATRGQSLVVVEDRTDARRIHEAHVAHVDREGSAAGDGFPIAVCRRGTVARSSSPSRKNILDPSVVIP